MTEGFVTRARAYRIALIILPVMLAAISCTTTMDRSELATEYYNLGTAFFDLGDLPRSADYLSRAIELDESLAQASYNLARVYALQGRFGEAEALLNSLRLLEPDNTTIIETLAYVAYSRGELDTAASTYDEVLQIDPGNLNALYNRALIADETGDLERASVLLHSASAVDERDVSVLELLASVEQRRDNPSGAISALEDLKEIGSISVEARIRLADLYEESERYDLALEELEVVVTTADTLESQSGALFRKGRILLTAAEEPEAGVAALRLAFESGFSDRDQIEKLRSDPRFDPGGEAGDLLSEYAAEPVDPIPGETSQEGEEPPAAPPGETGDK